jgi:hypothetical protein
MPFGFAIGAAGAIGGALISGSASQSAANTEASAANAAAQVQQNMFNQTQANLLPYMGAGTNALAAYQAALGLGGQSNAQIMNQLQNTPGYQFQLQQGLGAINNAASAAGGVNSGNTLRALTQYGQGLANQTYQQYLGNLSGLAGSGQNAAANLGGLSASVGSNIGSSLIGAGNALAAGTVGQANALNSAFGNIGTLALLSGGGGGSGNALAGWGLSGLS